MSRTTTYEEILATMPEGIEATILAILRNHVGSENAITLQALTAQALGDCNTTTERQTREAIEHLRRKGVAVLSESGKSGRWLAKDQAEKDACVAEMMGRSRNLMKTIESLAAAQVPVPAQITETNQPQQTRLWED